jgi:hypothetical protein
LDYRKELNEFERKEALRVQKENEQKAELERINLRNK